jgi:SAM-dependent methyltransferase
MPFGHGCFQTVMATEVLEHCPEPSQTLTEIGRVLAVDGVFFFTVPFLWNLHEVPHDEYRYTPFALERLLRGAGFADIDIKATGGWHASLAQMLGLWVRRAPMGKRKRRYLSYLLKPVIAYLAKKDVPPEVFKGGTMITGLYGTARKPS